MADERIIAQDTFEQAIKDILTELVNNTYDWQEYTDTEISDILEITDEQAMELSKIISDSQIANNKLWSSSKTDTEIKNALIESNKYADELIGQISSISLEYVTTLPTSDIKSNVIYILQGTPNTLNVYNESASSFVSVGDLNLDLSGYYTSTQVDNLLADKADDNTVVHADDVVQDLTTTSGTTVLSSAGLQTELDKKIDKSANLSKFSDTPSDENTLSEKAIKTELDKKIDKTSITTSISKTSTDDEVASAKAVFTSIDNIQGNLTSLTSVADLNNFKGKSFMIGRGTEYNNTTVNIPNGVSGAFVVEYLPYYDGENYGVQRITMVQPIGGKYSTFERSLDNGNWMGWQRLCTTSVADVGRIDLTAMLLNATVNSGGGVYYSIKNGICYFQIHGIVTTVDSSAKTIIGSGCLPTPDMNFTNGHYALASADSKNGLLVVDTNGSARFYGGEMTIFTSFSYPVKES